MKTLPLLILAAALSPLSAVADPQLTSWFTENSTRYARLYTDAAAETAGAASTTWSRGQGTQASPVYADVSQIQYSDDWVYIRTSGLASHLMGPWYLNAARTANFPNFPANQAAIHRFPRRPVIPASRTLTGAGPIGRMVNGVAMFDMRDTFSYSNASGRDADPTAGIGTGDGIWVRDAYPNEGVTFDAAYAHQAGSNYHYHAQPVALRWQLGDHVSYDPVTNRYTETAGPPAGHSPILGWANDGLPVYGPFGYSDPQDPASPVRRMVSGFILRDGTRGTTDLAATGRTSLAAWSRRWQNRTTLTASQYGPAVSTAYALGHYLEDYDYLGDLGYVHGTDFDLNEQNVRYCVTPEFPQGTWAYFTPVGEDGTPLFPYTVGRQYFGSPTGGSTSIPESVSTFYQGGPNAQPAMQDPRRDAETGSVILTWSAVEGGTYTVQTSGNLQDWSTLNTPVTAVTSAAGTTDTGASAHSSRFYRVARTGLAPFDTNGFDYQASGTGTGTGTGSTATAPGGSATRGTSVTVTITLPNSPPVPPAGLLPATITLGGISGTGISRPSATTAAATFAIPAGAATGAQNVVVTFNPGPTYTLTAGFTLR